MAVLMATVVLAMLSTALVVLNRSGFLSLNQYEQRSIAMQACYAGLDYARARLVQVSGWSTLAYGPLTTILQEPSLQVDESGTTQPENLVEGRLLLTNSSFRVQVVNNLGSNFQTQPPSWSHSQVIISPRTAFVAVEGRSGSVQRRIEVLLNRKTGVGGAVYAGGDLAVTLAAGSTGKVLNFSSSVPKSNLVKANGTIRLPDPANVDFSTGGGHGRLQSGADTVVNSTYTFTDGNVTNPQNGEGLSGNSGLTSSVAHEVKANITTNSPPSPPKFTPDQLKQPTTSSNTLPGGDYHFINHETVVYRATPNSTPTTYWKSMNVGGSLVELSEFRFMPQGNIEVTGDIHLSGEQHEVQYDSMGHTISDKVVDMPVTLAVGYDKFGLPLSYSALGTATTTKNRFTVTGNVTVDGDLVGSGQIFVKKNSQGQGGSMSVNGNSFLSATRTDGMALVAEDSVTFGEVAQDPSTQLFAMLPNEFDLYANALFPQSNYPTQIQKTFQNWQGVGSLDMRDAVGSSDLPLAGTLRGTVLGGDYQQTLDAMIPGGFTPHQKDLNLLLVPITIPDGQGNLVTQVMPAKDLIAQYVTECQAQGGMTLGLHTRLREFIKSLDRVNPNSDMINLWNPTAFELQSLTVRTLVANQVSAYNQDARTNGKRLLAYMAGANPYRESQRRDFIFGGILYARGNVYTRLANSFNLLGSMMSQQGTLGFDNLNSAKIVYDPNSFEDQFDLTKMGLGPVFFWMGP